jgi:hypothetical protein
MTAVLAALPLAWLPLAVADPMFVGLGTATLAWVLMRDRLDDPRLLVFISGAGVLALQTSQWSPLLSAAALTPVLGALLACKPTLGLALLIAYPSKGAAIGFAAFLLLSLLARPAWPAEWLHGLPAATHLIAPVTRPAGLLVLAAIVRWRRPEARLLVALSCMPQTPELYEAVPFFLMPGTWAESGGLLVLTLMAGAGHRFGGPYTSYDAYMSAGGLWMLWALFIPATIWIVTSNRFRSDPSEGLSRKG